MAAQLQLHQQLQLEQHQEHQGEPDPEVFDPEGLRQPVLVPLRPLKLVLHPHWLADLPLPVPDWLAVCRHLSPVQLVDCQPVRGSHLGWLVQQLLPR